MGKEVQVSVKPVLSSDNSYKIGLWIRDCAEGIGTLTFYDQATLIFGALGHGVYDSDTGALIDIKGGKITGADITGITKGIKGSPGELLGSVEETDILGNISLNTSLGLYGSLTEKGASGLSDEKLPICLKEDIQEGSAYILSDIDGTGPKKYQIEIEKINLNGKPDKGLTIRITDPNLIEKTGGIIQGMSGSPIIQNGKIVGAVTHVLVNNPTKGYGVFIESMLAEIPG